MPSEDTQFQKGHKKNKIKIDNNWLYQKYIIERLSCIKIADLYKCSGSVIYNSLKEFDIKIRNKSEAKSGRKFTEKHRKNLSISHQRPLYYLRTGKNIRCLVCQKEFYITKYEIEHKKKFCSQKCKVIYYKKNPPIRMKGINKGRHFSSKTEFKKGLIPWNYKGGISKTSAYKIFYARKRKIRMKNVVGNHTFGEWILLKKQYRNHCLWCKKCEPEIILTEDHIIPISKGGSNYIENIQPLCKSCNSKKFTRIIDYRNIYQMNPKTRIYRASSDKKSDNNSRLRGGVKV